MTDPRLDRPISPYSAENLAEVPALAEGRLCRVIGAGQDLLEDVLGK